MIRGMPLGMMMDKKPRLLDLFGCAGGAAKGYQRAGFHVTGIDIKFYKRYCGDAFIRADALEYVAAHGQEYDAIHASPPCQAYCTLKNMPNAKVHPELIEPTRAALISTGLPFVIENVVGAPLNRPTMLCGTMFGLGTGDAELRRHRLFETNWPLVLPMGMHCKHGRRAKTITVVGAHGDPGMSNLRQRMGGRVISVHDSHGRGHDESAAHLYRRSATGTLNGDSGGKSAKYKSIYFSSAERNEAMGIDWMKGGEISQAIPPAYTEFIGKQLIKLITGDEQER